MIRLAGENWRQYGNVLGTNEIVHLMLDRDLTVLGISDGFMCAATGFGLFLQKMIFQKKISWDKSGWVIQSVRFLSGVMNILLTAYLTGLGSRIYCRRPMLDIVP